MNGQGQWPFFDKDDVDAVVRVLRSGRVNQWTGDEVGQFQEEYARYVGVRHAVAVANGTVALELALHALGIGLQDEVIVPCRTFLATATAVVLRNAVPVFADVDRESQLLTVDSAERVRTPRTRALIAVHLAGWPCELQKLREYCDAHGLALIEDCAQAHGARVHGLPVGAGGHAGAFSFCQDKIITTGGEGGLLVADDPAVFKRAWSFKDHGRDHELATASVPHGDGFRWLCTQVGTNWRMTEMQAALGRRGLAKLDDMVRQRRANASILDSHLAGLAAVRVPRIPEHVYHSFYKYYAFVVPAALRSGWDRNRLMRALIDQGVSASVGICPEIYREQAFAAVPYPDGTVRNLQPAQRLPIAAELAETSLMFQVHPTLTERDMEELAGRVVRVLRQAQR